MSNNISFYLSECICIVLVHGIENWVATVEMSFRITAYTGNVVASRITSCEMNEWKRRCWSRRGSRASLMIPYDITMCPPVRAQICFAFDVSRNSVTGIRILSFLSLSLFERNSQRCRSTFRNGRCQRLHSTLAIAEIRLFWRQARRNTTLWPELFQNSSNDCQNLPSLPNVPYRKS